MFNRSNLSLPMSSYVTRSLKTNSLNDNRYIMAYDDKALESGRPPIRNACVGKIHFTKKYQNNPDAKYIVCKVEVRVIIQNNAVEKIHYK